MINTYIIVTNNDQWLIMIIINVNPRFMSTPATAVSLGRYKKQKYQMKWLLEKYPKPN